MSSLTTCNHCNLKRMRRYAEQEGKVITLRNGNGGVYVHKHNPGETIDTKPWDDDNKQIIAWMMAIGDECGC